MVARTSAPSANGLNPMKIGTLLTAAIVSLSAVGGGLAVYVAASKYQTMDKVSVAQSRLEVVRAVGEIPRYMNPERGFATNIMFGPPAVDPKLIAELDKYRRNTDGARDKMNQVKATLAGAIEDSAAVGSSIDALNTQFAALRAAIDKALTGPAEARRDAAKKIVSDNSVFNKAVTTLLDEQVRKIALLDGAAYRQASYANIAWTLRDVGGFNSSLHKNLIGANRVATEAEKMEISRSQGRNDQILMSLQELRGNPTTPANVAAALDKMNAGYVARFSFLIALAGLIAVATASAGLIVMVRRRVCRPIVDLTATMSQLASGDVSGDIAGAGRGDEIGAMAAAVRVFKDSMIEAERLAAEKAAASNGKMRRAQVLDELTRVFEAKVTELVGGLSSASSIMEDTAQSMSSTATLTNRQAAIVAAASEQTSANVQTVASATEELASSISEIGRQVAQSSEIDSRAVDNARLTGDTVSTTAGGASNI